METVIQRLNEVHNTMQARRTACTSGDAKRCVALAMTALEEARMWFNAAMAHQAGVFNVADVEPLAFKDAGRGLANVPLTIAAPVAATPPPDAA